jgi:hypothetical protein
MNNANKQRFNQMVIPVKKAIFTEGFFRWTPKPILASCRTADMLILMQLQDDIRQRLGYHADIILNAFGPATVRIHRDAAIKHDEAYRITIRSTGIEIAAKTDAGIYYAIQTLRDLICLYGFRLPACRIDDEPVFKRRGVYHDCSRGKVPTLETLKQLVDRLAHWKINELQLYIENVFTFVRHPDIGKGFSPFTPEEILALQEHCKKHHVRLVGSLSSFGHMENILSLPAYQHLGEMPGFRNLPGGTTLCPTHPQAIRLVSELYEEFVPLFEASDFNVCCDETWELGKGHSKTLAQKIGIGQLYLDFLLKIHRLCEKYGKRMNAWADILLKYPEMLRKLPGDIVLLNWEYEHNGANIKRTQDIARSGIDFMVCPGTSSWLTHGSRIPNSMQNIRAFAKQGLRYHAQGLLNTDWGDNGHRNLLGVSLHSFAHGAAHAWNSNAVDEACFTENFCRQTFGQPAKQLARALKTLGSAYLICGTPRRNGSFLFEALTEPIKPPASPEHSSIEKMTAAGLNKVVHQLSAENLWPKLSNSPADFERTAICELKLAAQMDCLSAERALAVNAFRKKGEIDKSHLCRLANRMEHLGENFRKLWLKRNKPSRLNDNLRLFDKTRRQMLRLAEKHRKPHGST